MAVLAVRCCTQHRLMALMSKPDEQHFGASVMSGAQSSHRWRSDHRASWRSHTAHCAAGSSRWYGCQLGWTFCFVLQWLEGSICNWQLMIYVQVQCSAAWGWPLEVDGLVHTMIVSQFTHMHTSWALANLPMCACGSASSAYCSFPFSVVTKCSGFCKMWRAARVHPATLRFYLRFCPKIIHSCCAVLRPKCTRRPAVAAVLQL
jgi:hypothetical protein